ncbi:hypothetical protein GVN24_14230 [Rhizobium sp. CRIBSB]|nr:hypothetical protein [Rhizobium sp. CRIBSB]
MNGDFDPEVLRWYKGFVHSSWDADDHVSPNFLVSLSDAELTECDQAFGKLLPKEYLDFVRLVGYGRISCDVTGFFSEYFSNYIFSPSEINSILVGDCDHLNTYIESFSEDSIPFFYLGSGGVLTFSRRGDGAVYSSGLYHQYADSFGVFLAKLMNDANFYIKEDAAVPVPGMD